MRLAAPHGSASGLLVHSYFTDTAPASDAIRVVSRWYDEAGIERRSVSRTAEPAAEGSAMWHTHTVPMWELRPYPGRWTAKVWVDGAPAGEYSFSLAR